MSIEDLIKRVEERISAWDFVVQDTLETQSSYIAYGIRGNQPVVLKAIRQQGDEWGCGDVLKAFDGKGMVRVYECAEGAVLLERLSPGTSLAAMALDGRDEEATEIIAELIEQLSHPLETTNEFASVGYWGNGFERYLKSADNQIPTSLVEQAQHLYFDLSASQQEVRLLHGDLQHYNILFDSERGWVAIDPKGVIGEIEYEIGASLRNPNENLDLIASPKTLERRLKIYESKLKIDYNRALGWGFAQAVLSAIWMVEDGYDLNSSNPAMILANVIQPML